MLCSLQIEKSANRLIGVYSRVTTLCAQFQMGRNHIMKRTHHRIVSVFLFVIWLILFILMQFVSFDWSNKNELRLCLQMIGLFFLQFPVIRCFQKQRASRIILAFSVLYGVFLMIKDVCFILAVVRPNWHGPLALFFTCLMCDLVGFIRCRRSFKRLSQADSFST